MTASPRIRIRAALLALALCALAGLGWRTHVAIARLEATQAEHGQRMAASGAVVGPGQFPAQQPDTWTEQQSSPQSLVNSDVSHPSWIVASPALAPVARPLAGDSTKTGLRSLVLVNEDGLCPSNGYLSRPFTTPSGVTGIALEIDEAQLPGWAPSTSYVVSNLALNGGNLYVVTVAGTSAGSGGPTGTGAGIADGGVTWNYVGVPGSWTLALYDLLGSGQLASVSITPTATPTAYTTGTITVTAGQEYQVRLMCPTSGATNLANALLVGRLRVRPTVSSDPFWTTTGSGGFKRIELYGSLQENNESNVPASAANSITGNWVDPHYPPQLEGSFVEIDTTARAPRWGVLNTIGNYIGAANSGVTPTVDGYPLDPPWSATIGVVSYQTLAIPAPTVPGSTGASPRKLRIPTGPSALSALQAPATEPRGAYSTDLFVPLSSYIKLYAAPVEVGVVFGDSKMADFYSDSPGRDSVAFMLRTKAWRFIAQAKGGGSLYQETSQATIKIDACRPFARKLARLRPTKVVLAIGRNDWTGLVYTAANLKAQLANMADAIHEANPNGQVVLMTWTSEASSTEVSEAGTAWDTERESIRTICAGTVGDGATDTSTQIPWVGSSRSSWCTVLDAARFWTVAASGAYSADGTHPNSRGQARITDGLAGFRYPWTPLELGTTFFLESGPGGDSMSGGAMAAVSCTGTCGVSPSLSGTATQAKHWRAEVTQQGTIGTAQARWSWNFGRTWYTQNFAVNSAAALGNGITANFVAGTWTQGDVYVADGLIATWKDESGNGNNAVQATPALQPVFVSSCAGAIGPSCTKFAAASTQYLHVAGISVTAPFTICASGTITDQATVRALLGRTGGTSGVLFYSNSATTMAGNSGGAQSQVTIAANVPHMYCLINNGAASIFYADGQTTVGNTVTMTAQTLTDQAIGGDVLGPYYWDNQVTSAFLVPRAVTGAELYNIGAWARARGYGQ